MIEIKKAVSEITSKTSKEADKLILEYMKKRNLTLDDLKGNIAMQNVPILDLEINTTKLNYYYKDELILSVMQKFDFEQPTITRCELIIKKGNW